MFRRFIELGAAKINISTAIKHAYPGNGELLDIMGEAYTTMLSGTSLEDAMERVNERAEELAEEY